MRRGRKRALPSSAVTLAKKQYLDAGDNRMIQEAMDRIQARDRSQTRRDDIYKSNATESPLLCLPAELRNMIFRWVFRGVEYGLVDNWRPLDSVVPLQVKNASGSHTLDDLNLPLVCRQIYAETALLPYSLGTFDIWDKSLSTEEGQQAVGRFLKERTHEQIDAISSLVIETFEDEDGYLNLVEQTGAYWVANMTEAEY
ncbi:hypothetical protein J4E81_003448 [Alternaria sp. BMP 2799]|nr:hypothetical protein J4E81_003448 [Alternaria sp. BMP 2799]